MAVPFVIFIPIHGGVKMNVKMEEKSKNQRMLDIIAVALAVLSSLILVLVTDDLLMDIITIVIPIWATFGLMFTRHGFFSGLLSTIGIVVCILGYVYSPDNRIPLIIIFGFCIVCLINGCIGGDQRTKMDKQKSDLAQKERSEVIEEIKKICIENSLSYSGGAFKSINIEVPLWDISSVEKVKNEFLSGQRGRRYAEYMVGGTYEESYTTTSREKIGEMKVRDDNYRTIAKVDVKGDVKEVHQYQARINEKFNSYSDAARYAQTKSMKNGQTHVFVYLWYKGTYEDSQTIIACIGGFAMYSNGVPLENPERYGL